MGARLIGQDVGSDAASHELGKNFGSVAEQADRQGLLRRLGFVYPAQRFLETRRLAIAVSSLETLVDSRLVHFDAEDCGTIHRCGERLRAAHATKAGGEHEASGQRPSEMRSANGAKRLVGALHDALRSDVDP